MSGTIVYEVCVEDAEGACAAERGGADRVELCAGLPEGGTTPSIGAIEEARAGLHIPVVTLVRPRPGDFVYTRRELDVMLRDVSAARAAGVAGVALGALTPDGEVDLEATGELIDAARPLDVTFHRAFDLTRDPRAALESLATLKVERILTSGAGRDAADGADLLRALVQQAGARLTILAAGGVRAHNVAALVRSTGAREVHGSAYRVVDGDRSSPVSLGTEATTGGGRRRMTDESIVRAVVDALRR